jgi:hypothetical protein
MAEHTRDASGGRSPEPASGPGRGVLGWIAGVFVDPKGTFGEIAGVIEERHPTDPAKTKDGSKWWVPFVIAIVVTAAVSAYTVPKIVMPERMEIAREAMIEQGASQADIDRAIEMSSAIGGPVGVVGAAVVTVIIFFVAAGLTHLFAKMVGGKGRFRHARAVTAYAMMITTLGGLVKLPMMISRQTMLVSTGPAILMGDVEPTDRLFLFLQSGFDIFTIWSLVVTLFGVAILYRLATGKAAVTVVLLWLIFTALGTFGGGGFGG